MVLAFSIAVHEPVSCYIEPCKKASLEVWVMPRKFKIGKIKDVMQTIDSCDQHEKQWT